MRHWFVSLAAVLTNVGAYAGSPPSESPSAFYLCTYCVPGTYARYDDFFSTQVAMFKAQSGKMISVGNAISNEAINKEARLNQIPLESDTRGLTPMKNYRSGNPEDTKIEMTENILKQLKQLDRSKPVTIHIADHGWNGNLSGTGTLPPEKSGIVLKTQTNPYQNEKDLILTHEEFSELLKKAGLVGPQAPPLRIVSEHCYGGGAHWISEKFPNVCTAAFTSNEEPNYSNDNEAKAFWNHVDERKKANRSVSMTEAFYAGWSSKSNEYSEGGALGSTQYIRGLLKKNGIDSKKLAEDTLSQWTQWSELKEIHLSETSCSIPAPLAPLSFAEVTSIQKIMATIQPEQSAKPKEFTEALLSIQKTGAQDQKILDEYLLRFKESQSAWNKLSLEQKAIRSREYTDDMDSFMDWLKGDFNSNKNRKLNELELQQAALQTRFLNFKKLNDQRIQAYIKNRELLARMGELDRFSQLVETGKITPAELKTYQRMVACESLPL
jgi:hypothetical protein